MDYVFTITEFNADNVDSVFTTLGGRIERWFDLTQKTYTVYAKSDTTPTETTDLVWTEKLEEIRYYIGLELNRLNARLLLEKTRLYEIQYFGFYIPRTANDEQDAKNDITATQDIITFLKNYIP